MPSEDLGDCVVRRSAHGVLRVQDVALDPNLAMH